MVTTRRWQPPPSQLLRRYDWSRRESIDVTPSHKRPVWGPSAAAQLPPRMARELPAFSSLHVKPNGPDVALAFFSRWAFLVCPTDSSETL